MYNFVRFCVSSLALLMSAPYSGEPVVFGAGAHLRRKSASALAHVHVLFGSQQSGWRMCSLARRKCAPYSEYQTALVQVRIVFVVGSLAVARISEVTSLAVRM